MKNKQAGIMDIFIFMVIAFAVVLIFGAFIFIFGILDTTFSEIDVIIGDNTTFSSITDTSFTPFNEGVQQLRIIAVAIVFGMFVTIIVSNLFAKAHPIFLVVYFMITIIAIIVAVPVSNAYELLLTDSVLGATYQSFLGMNFLLLNLPMIVGFMSLIGALALFIGITRDRELGGGIV